MIPRPNFDAYKVPVAELFKPITAATTLEVHEQIVYVTMTTAAYALTLPNVAQAQGRAVAIYMKTNATPRVLTIQDQDESVGWVDKQMSTAGGHIILFSDGYMWHELARVDGASQVTLAEGTTAITRALHSVEVGKTLLLGQAGGILANLPEATGSGDRYRFLITVSVTSSDVYKIAADSADTIQGMAFFMTDTSGVMIAFKAGGTADYVNMDGSTQGGLIGAILEFTDVADTTWDCQYHGDATGSEATPFVAT